MRIEIRQLIVLVLLCGFLAGSYFLGFKRLKAQREFYTTDISKKEQAVASLAATTASVDDLKRQIAELEQTLKFFEQRIPRQKEVDAILDDVWMHAESNGLTTRSVRPLKADRNGQCVEQPMEITFSGSYKAYYGFLQKLEHLQRITRVTSLELKKPSDAESFQQQIDGKMVMNIYFEPDSFVASTKEKTR
jgi:Tfp pilus assembly protein PilO